MKKITKEEFQKEVIETPGYKLVKFSAIWCSPCRLLTKTIKPLITDKLPIYEVDIDDQEELASEYNIMTIPVLLLFKDNCLLKRINNPLSIDLKEEIFDKYQNQ